MADEENNRTRQLAKLVRELVTTEHFDRLADLTDALKFRCARLRIPWTNDTISAAYTLVASNRPLVGQVATRTTNPTHLELAQGPDPVTRGEAPVVLDQVFTGVLHYIATRDRTAHGARGVVTSGLETVRTS
jgi:hypothetical protein